MPIAQRATVIAREDPTLLGGGFAPDLQWHVAIIQAAVNDVHQASAELSAAFSADLTLGNRAEIQKLQQ